MAVILEIVNGALSEDLGAAATPVTSQQVRVLIDMQSPFYDNLRVPTWSLIDNIVFL